MGTSHATAILGGTHPHIPVPRPGLTMAVSGTGGGSEMRAIASLLVSSQTSAASCASGARGVATGNLIGLTSVTTRATQSGRRLAISRAIVPPRLMLTRETR